MPHPSKTLIPEIQGLRAVAVLSVLIYHLWPKALPGGYVGVDVFFVISGFLITGLLFREFETTGQVDIAGFYARRIRRLLPAATLVSLAVALMIPLFPKSQWHDIANSIIASTLYSQNWYLAAQAVDYLADDAKGPMNHFWSLSVEEQYYIVWPLLIVPLLRLARKALVGPRAAFGGFVALIGAGSLAYSIYLTRADAGVAYFATTTRAWELAIGGGLVLLWGRLILPDGMRAALGLCGLAAIVTACFTFSDNTPFPGYTALLPTLGAAAVILSSGARPSWPVGGVLSLKPVQHVGDISYSLYLWHWPLIVAYSQVTGHPVGIRGGVTLMLASFGLAHLSKVFVEDYFRTLKFSPRAVIAAGVGCLVITSGAGIGYLVREAADPIAATEAPRGAVAMKDPSYAWRKEDLSTVVPSPDRAKDDVSSAYALGCHQNKSRTNVVTCDYGNPKSDLKIVVLGDSHATHWFPAFEELARRRSIYVRGVSKSSCLFSLEPLYSKSMKRPYTECSEWSKNVIEWLAQERPDIVLISQSHYSPGVAVKGMIAAWKRLTDMNLDVRGISATPWMPFQPDQCLETSRNWLVDCSPLRSAVFKADLVPLAAKALNVQTLDFSDYFCDAKNCPVVIGRALVYRDAHHMTATFSKTLSGPMEDQLFPRKQDALDLRPSSRRGALAMTDSGYNWRSEDLATVEPRPVVVRRDAPAAYADKCHQNVHGTSVLSCDFGSPDSPFKIVMLGDSHATHWFPAFEELARAKPVYFRGVAKSACLFSLEAVYNGALKRTYTECVEWSKNVTDWLAREKPDLVLISQTPFYGMTGVSGMVSAWTQLLQAGLNVQAVASTPVLPFRPEQCLESSGDWTTDCVPSRSKAFMPDPVSEAARNLNVKTLDFSDYFCDSSECPIIIGGVLAYRDTDHMTATFSKTFSKIWEEKLSLSRSAELPNAR